MSSCSLLTEDVVPLPGRRTPAFHGRASKHADRDDRAGGAAAPHRRVHAGRPRAAPPPGRPPPPGAPSHEGASHVVPAAPRGARAARMVPVPPGGARRARAPRRDPRPRRARRSRLVRRGHRRRPCPRRGLRPGRRRLDRARGRPPARRPDPRRPAVAARRRRPDAEQAIAANIDVVAVVHGLDRPLRDRRLHRALALAWESGATPVVVLTKADVDGRGAATRALDAEVGVRRRRPSPSARARGGPRRAAAPARPDRTLVLIGESAPGSRRSSTPSTGQRGARDRRRPRRRRTRAATPPPRAGWCRYPAAGALIDTPGVRELGLWGSPVGVQATFADIATLAEGCRYADCRHDGEPGCAVAAAVAAGPSTRALDSHRDLVREMASLAPARRRARVARPRPPGVADGPRGGPPRARPAPGRPLALSQQGWPDRRGGDARTARLPRDREPPHARLRARHGEGSEGAGLLDPDAARVLADLLRRAPACGR